METKDIIFKLRTEKGLSQEERAEKLCVTRQAVSRWETGETQDEEILAARAHFQELLKKYKAGLLYTSRCV